MKPIRTYEVKVDGYSEVLYCARSPAKARWRAYVDFGVVSTCSFGEFLARSRIRRIPDPPGVGERILVSGKPATKVLPIGWHHVYFIFDDADHITTSHPLDVKPMPVAP